MEDLQKSILVVNQNRQSTKAKHVVKQIRKPPEAKRFVVDVLWRQNVGDELRDGCGTRCNG